MIQAFYTGLNGMQTSSYGINIVSDNLANADTVGFKESTYEFSSLFDDAVVTANAGSTYDSVGLGTQLQSTPMTTSSGSYMLTDRNTDLAILEDGWFGVKRNSESTAYTRDGSFSFDSNGSLVALDGSYVLGTMGTNFSDGVLTDTLNEVPLGDVATQEPLTFPQELSYPTTPTTTAEFYGNLGTDAELRSMSSGVIDTDGTTNDLHLEFTQVDPQPETGTEWSVVATTSSLDGETLYDTQSGIVTFDETGALTSSTLPAIDNNGTPVSINFGTGYDGLISTANKDISASSSSDGFAGGDLTNYDINTNGDVVATFSNGIQSSVGKVAVYHFQNDQGLDRLSGTQFSASSNSGDAIFYTDENGKNILGTDIANNQLESSNVDMTYSLTELIILQRSYDANSKSITTADEMLQKALEMDG
jgi:flagellar hook protein FlgE